MKHAATVLVLLGVACGEEEQAPADLLIPSAVPVAWEDAYNAADDGLGALVPLDVMVYDGATGEPIEDVEVLVSSTDDGAVPIPTDGVVVVVGPDALVEEEPSFPGPSPGSPDLAWDSARDQYVVLPETDGPTLQLETDETGVARLYLYVDAFPSDGDHAFDDITVVVTLVDPSEPEALRGGSFLLVAR